MSTAAQAATSGAARKARERKARTQARHVCWLAGNFQTLATHHTGVAAAGSVLELRAEVQLLKVALRDMQAELASLRSQGRSSDDPRMQEEVVQPGEVPGKEVQPVEEVPPVFEDQAMTGSDESVSPLWQKPGAEAIGERRQASTPAVRPAGETVLRQAVESTVRHYGASLSVGQHEQLSSEVIQAFIGADLSDAAVIMQMTRAITGFIRRHGNDGNDDEDDDLPPEDHDDVHPP